MSCILDLMNNEAPKDFANKKRVMRDSAVEFVSTMLFVFAGTLSAVSTGSKLVAQGDISENVARILPIAMTFGVTILAMAYSIGHISGCHLNPGVSLLMFFRRKMSFPKMICYWIVQLLGAMVGAALTWGCTSGLSGFVGDSIEISDPPFLLGSTTLNPELSMGNGFLLELLGSFIFYFVIAQTALDTRGVADTPFPGIPIGLSLVVVHICLVPFTGCGVNPARSFGPSMITCMSGNGHCDTVFDTHHWIYWAGPFLAAFLVAEVTTIMEMDVGDEKETAAVVEEKAISNTGATTLQEDAVEA